MKKWYIVAAVALMSAFGWSASAQQFRFGIEAGGTISHSSWELKDGMKAKSVGGYTIGITAEYEIYDNVWLQSGLTFGTKGAKAERKDKEVDPIQYPGIKRDEINTYRPMYVQIPVTVAYKFNLTGRTRFFLAGGVFLSQGIAGEYNKKWTYNEAGISQNWGNVNDSESVFSTDAIKRFDCGLNIGGGFEFGKLVLRVGYDWSLIDIVKDKAKLGADQFKNRSIAIAAGLKF